MSMISSTPRITSTPASGRLKLASVPERMTSDALGTPATPFDVSMSVSIMMICVEERQVLARRLSHEDRGHREVERRAVEIEAVAGRQDEPDHAAGHAHPLHVLHRQRQGRLARRGGERDRRRSAHGRR